jgi:hypothetical protein
MVGCIVDRELRVSQDKDCRANQSGANRRTLFRSQRLLVDTAIYTITSGICPYIKPL